MWSDPVRFCLNYGLEYQRVYLDTDDTVTSPRKKAVVEEIHSEEETQEAKTE